MLLTACYADETKAIELAYTIFFSRASQDNETMHVEVIAKFAKKYKQDGFLLHKLVPPLFPFFYFAASFLLCLFSPRSALEFNYLFEDHAFA